MRLLHIATLGLHEFFGSRIPPYAILSHRWEENEISFKDVRKSRNLDSQGWRKVQKFCSFLREHEPLIEHAWVNTVCIDKRSSAELSEAINSMYNCSLENSRWFTGGWTLQELLAPSEVYFLDKDWRMIDVTKTGSSDLLFNITGIPPRVLKEIISPRDFIQSASIAAKMSWASRRICTREEDNAYSLMGLFNVNMPLLYGEGGTTAFRRLQTEIIKSSDEESIFAWSPHNPARSWSGMLARSAKDFETLTDNSPTVMSEIRRLHKVPHPEKWFTPSIAEYSMTNKGLKLEATLGPHMDYTYVNRDSCRSMCLRPVALNCGYSNDVSRQPYIVFLEEFMGKYHRVHLPEKDRRDLIKRALNQEKQTEVAQSTSTSAREVFYVRA